MRAKPIIERIETVDDFLARGGRITRVNPGVSRHLTTESAIIARMLGASTDDVLDDDQRSSFGPSVRAAVKDAETAGSSMTGFDDVVDVAPDVAYPLCDDDNTTEDFQEAERSW